MDSVHSLLDINHSVIKNNNFAVGANNKNDNATDESPKSGGASTPRAGGLFQF